jgi:SAM-dependent methyltransferase
MSDQGSGYLHGYASSVLDSHSHRTVANSAAYLAPHLTPGTQVLDLGCGAGTITAGIAALVAPSIVTAVDIDEGVLAVARQAARTAGVDNVEFLIDDVGSLGFADATFDVAHAHQVLQHLADPVAALRELSRVTRPGGLVAVRDADYAAFTWYPSHPGLDAWLALYEAVARHGGGEPDAGRHLLAWAHAAGFTEVAVSGSTWTYARGSGVEWWAGTWSERVVSSAFADQAVAAGLATRAELDGLSRAWREWAVEPDAWFMVPHAELLATVGPRSADRG